MSRIQNSLNGYLKDIYYDYSLLKPYYNQPKWYLDKFDGLLEFVSSIDAADDVIGIFCMVTQPKSSGFVHIDSTDRIQSNRRWALNVPIANTSDTKMQWYSSGHLVQTMFLEPYGNFLVCDCDDNDVIEELELTESFLVRTDIPHGVVSNNTGPRIILSITLDKPDLWIDFRSAYHQKNSENDKLTYAINTE